MSPQFDTENPASSIDVARALTDLVGHVQEARETYTGKPEDFDPHVVHQVAEAEAAYAVALETWLAEAQQYLAATVVGGLTEPLMKRLEATHDDLHKAG